MSETRIVATVGPSCADAATITAMEQAGVDTFRVNCSHVPTIELAPIIERIRSASRHAAVLVDIQGPKLRTGDRELVFHERQTVRLEPCDLSFDPFTVGVRPGETMLLGDGTVNLQIAGVGPGETLVRVVRGGTCLPRRGVNLPDTRLLPPGGLFNDKDRADIEVARIAGADWVALSFVGSGDDVEQARELVGPIRIISKIERREALDNLEAIGAVSDGLMAARGDLGVELPFETVPVAQQRIADWGLRTGKVTVCATEMLESMRSSGRPTRAEVSDVATAITQGYGALMLSAETSIGNDPVGVVRIMRSICTHNRRLDGPETYADAQPAESAVAGAVVALARRTNASSILALTYTGYSAEILSACRPAARIVAATPDERVARRLQLYPGVRTVLVSRDADMGRAVDRAAAAAVDAGLLRRGENVVVSASRENPRRPADTVWTYRVPTNE